MKKSSKEPGRIVRQGMGGFLNPPTHPEHEFSVETDLKYRPANRSRMSLSAAADAEWLDDATRAEARRILADWVAPSLMLKSTREWVSQVLGYFRHCYRNPNVATERQWHASEVIIDRDRDPVVFADHHAGVRLIRGYYPHYEPTALDFADAHWGTRTEPVEATDHV